VDWDNNDTFCTRQAFTCKGIFCVPRLTPNRPHDPSKRNHERECDADYHTAGLL